MDARVARERLEAALMSAMDDASRRVMQWGVDDCGLWFANVVKSALGFDPAAHLRGYHDRLGAMKALGPLGLAFALKVVAKHHGWPRIDPKDARVGDVGLALFGGNPTTMICRAPGWFVARNEVGFTALTDKVVRVAWSVA